MSGYSRIALGKIIAALLGPKAARKIYEGVSDLEVEPYLISKCLLLRDYIRELRPENYQRTLADIRALHGVIPEADLYVSALGALRSGDMNLYHEIRKEYEGLNGNSPFRRLLNLPR